VAGIMVPASHRIYQRTAVPLLFLQRFRGNLDNWDPALIDAVAATRRVATFDNAGAGGSTGTTPGTVSVCGSGEPERVPRPVRLVRACHGYGPQSADGLYCAERSVVSVSPELRADNSRARLSAVVALTVMAVAP
jgi:pimeloyl-ACP methyl ester carboxylesterase